MKYFTNQIWSGIGLSLLIQNPSLSQILPDATLPINSRITFENSTDVIEGGTLKGTHLFHSFREFSVPTGRAVYFNNAPTIQNIFTRITGNSISEINGLIRANGTANLFLLNPNGIIFGPNAALDIGGSFLGSTADSIKFADGFEFSANNPQVSPLLTVSVPVGLQMGSSSGKIIVRGFGHTFSIDPESEAVLFGNRPTGLQVEAGKTLALLANGVFFEGGHLTAESGNIQLGSVGDRNKINLIISNFNFKLTYEQVQKFADVYLTQLASISSRNVQIDNQRTILRNGSIIFGVTTDINPDNRFNINATELVEINGSSNGFPSSLVTTILRDATGNGGSLSINTRRLAMSDGGQVGAGTFGRGQSGNVIISASELVKVSGTSPEGIPSRLFTSALQSSSGNGGSLTIETRQLVVTGGAEIDAATIGTGNSGNISVTASELIEISGISIDGKFTSSLSTRTLPRSTGEGGNIILETGQLIIRETGIITASSQGAGQAGQLNITADSTRLDRGVISADTVTGGGDISLQSRSLILRQGSRITTNAQGFNVSGGNININTQVLSALENSDISANSQDFRGGRVNINTQGIFGIAFRDQTSDRTSDITATSERGAEFSGIVTVNTPNLDPAVALVPVNIDLLNPSQQIQTECQKYQGSRFTVVGRGGLPPTPFEPLEDVATWMDLREHPPVGQSQSQRIEPTINNSSAPPLLEATGWQRNHEGQIILTSNYLASGSWLNATNCQH